MRKQLAILFPIIFSRRLKYFGIKQWGSPLIVTTMKWTCILILSAVSMANTMAVTFQSSERQTALLEFYTSEGCSSCPPAEAWLSDLKRRPELWTDFVPVAFHVDYWNNLGWRDRLSSEEFTQRQYQYAKAWSAQEVYTPEFVLNGKEWHNWFGYRSAPSASAAKTGTLTVSSTDEKHWKVNFNPAEKESSDYEVTAALLVCGFSSDVTAGENSGRHLNHDFATLSLISRPLASATNGFQGSFIADPHPKGITGHLALAVWVTHSGQLQPLQATGGWLPQIGN